MSRRLFLSLAFVPALALAQPAPPAPPADGRKPDFVPCDPAQQMSSRIVYLSLHPDVVPLFCDRCACTQGFARQVTCLNHSQGLEDVLL